LARWLVQPHSDFGVNSVPRQDPREHLGIRFGSLNRVRGSSYDCATTTLRPGSPVLSEPPREVSTQVGNRDPREAELTPGNPFAAYFHRRWNQSVGNPTALLVRDFPKSRPARVSREAVGNQWSCGFRPESLGIDFLRG